jgi:putative transcriptional regulator
MRPSERGRELRRLLQRAEFAVSDPHGLRSVSFDLVARRGALILVAKSAENACSVDKVMCRELKVLSGTLGGASMIVAAHNGTERVEDGVIFSRFGVPVVSLGTLKDLFIEGVPPYVFAAPGGLYVRVDPDALTRARQRNISIGELAEAAGVSRRAIQMYGDGMGAMIEAAMRLERFLGEHIILPVDPFVLRETALADDEKYEAPRDGLRREVYAQLGKLGCSVYPIAKCPFDALTMERRSLYITGVSKDLVSAGEKAHVAFSVARVAGRQSVIFIDGRPKCTNVEGSPIIGKEELRKVRDPEELREMLKERGAKR